jgi:SAM-dependent methyltransferase
MHGGKLLLIVLFLGVFIKCGAYYFSDDTLCKFRHRNFYGTYSVIEVPPSEKNPDGIRQLVHGMTLHGAQLLTKEKESTPISYYYRGGPFADVYEATPSPRRLAVVGLGAGVVSAFLQPEDSLTYYEIDPDNEGIARTWFSFLDKAKTPVGVVVGDARLSLQNEPKNSKPYDVITIDAFTGDGIPTHLLTLEALEVYLSRLAPDGLLLFHISNRYYDLRPLMKAAGEKVNLHGVLNKPASANLLGTNDKAAQCVAFSRKAENLQPLRERGWVSLAEAEGLEKTVPWTDDYINILSPLFSRFKVR